MVLMYIVLQDKIQTVGLVSMWPMMWKVLNYAGLLHGILHLKNIESYKNLAYYVDSMH